MTVLRGTPALGQHTPSLVVTPAVVAHRGASGYRPEHTAEAYRTAVLCGADAIEIDLVITVDGVLVARHESELSTTTDVAARPELARLRTTRTIDGQEHTGWFVEDLTLAQVRTLRARERLAHLRPGSAAYDDEGVLTFGEVLDLVREESDRAGREVALMVELKSPTYFAGRGLALHEPLLADLRRRGLDHPRAAVTVMSFEATILRRLAGESRVALVQLLGSPGGRPADLVAAGDPRTYADLAGREGLREIDDYADGIGAHQDLVLPDGERESRLVRDAHRQWLTVYVWTLRAENHFLPSDFRVGTHPARRGDLSGQARAFLEAGVDGIITDHPDLAVGAVAQSARRGRLADIGVSNGT